MMEQRVSNIQRRTFRSLLPLEWISNLKLNLRNIFLNVDICYRNFHFHNFFFFLKNNNKTTMWFEHVSCRVQISPKMIFFCFPYCFLYYATTSVLASRYLIIPLELLSWLFFLFQKERDVFRLGIRS